jgi:hypothetical protein
MHHPPDEKQGHNTKDDVRDPVASGFGFAEVAHEVRVARVFLLVPIVARRSHGITAQSEAGVGPWLYLLRL